MLTDEESVDVLYVEELIYKFFVTQHTIEYENTTAISHQLHVVLIFHIGIALKGTWHLNMVQVDVAFQNYKILTKFGLNCGTIPYCGTSVI